MAKFFKIIAGTTLVLSVFLFATIGVLSSSISGEYYVDDFESFKAIDKGANLSVHSNLESTLYTGIVKSASYSYGAKVKLFGVIEVKDVDVNVVLEEYLVPCGLAFGIKLQTDGVMVVGIGDVQTIGGEKNPGVDAGILFGDIIQSANGVKVNSNNELSEIISSSKGENIELVVRRENEVYSFDLKPEMGVNNSGYKAGLWVRDSSAGIGTMTYYDPKSDEFGGLGHPICDVDTGQILPVMTGEAVEVRIDSVVKGTQGIPGELQGVFSSNGKIGTITDNLETGIYGKVERIDGLSDALKVGYKQEIKEGPAQILSTIGEDGVKAYDIVIEKINAGDNNPSKNISVRIVDKELINKTGGIVQGMSGSPIIQNGKIIGAVTHVFVNDPTKGYGIYIENMINNAKSVKK